MGKKAKYTMMITVHLAGGRKITKDIEKLCFFTGESCRCSNGFLEIKEGSIAINLDNVLDMRPAEEDEIEHAKIHGW